jgi:hypothetical protein
LRPLGPVPTNQIQVFFECPAHFSFPCSCIMIASDVLVGSKFLIFFFI